jgi:hypothetical protein
MCQDVNNVWRGGLRSKMRFVNTTRFCCGKQQGKWCGMLWRLCNTNQHGRICFTMTYTPEDEQARGLFTPDFPDKKGLQGEGGVLAVAELANDSPKRMVV